METQIKSRFTIDLEKVKENMVEGNAFIQNNGDGTFSVSDGTRGFQFSLNDRDFIDLMTDRNQRRILFLEEDN
jgi:hypothetical protein